MELVHGPHPRSAEVMKLVHGLHEEGPKVVELEVGLHHGCPFNDYRSFGVVKLVMDFTVGVQWW